MVRKPGFYTIISVLSPGFWLQCLFLCFLLRARNCQTSCKAAKAASLQGQRAAKLRFLGHLSLLVTTEELSFSFPWREAVHIETGPPTSLSFTREVTKQDFVYELGLHGYCCKIPLKRFNWTDHCVLMSHRKWTYSTSHTSLYFVLLLVINHINQLQVGKLVTVLTSASYCHINTSHMH